MTADACTVIPLPDDDARRVVLHAALRDLGAMLADEAATAAERWASWLELAPARRRQWPEFEFALWLASRRTEREALAFARRPLAMVAAGGVA